jgi:hypothetical protein
MRAPRVQRRVQSLCRRRMPCRSLQRRLARGLSPSLRWGDERVRRLSEHLVRRGGSSKRMPRRRGRSSPCDARRVRSRLPCRTKAGRRKLLGDVRHGQECRLFEGDERLQTRAIARLPMRVHRGRGWRLRRLEGSLFLRLDVGLHHVGRDDPAVDERERCVDAKVRRCRVSLGVE